MCGRFFVDAKNRAIDRLLANLSPDAPPVQLGEVFPGQNALVKCLRDGQAAVESMSWGFPRRDGKGVIFNARVESVLEKPIFRRAFLHNPLAIPTSGFYEWTAIPGLKRKIKHFFRSESSLLYLAGFWNFFGDDPGEQKCCFTILTTEANAFMRNWHSRMPVLLHEHEITPRLKGQNRDTIASREPFTLREETVSDEYARSIALIPNS